MRKTCAVLLVVSSGLWPLQASGLRPLASGQSAGEDLPEVSHVRAMDTWAPRVIQQAMERSPTANGLIACVQRSDVIVYVEVARFLDVTMMRFVGRGPSVRYLLISLSARTTDDERVVLLGHELRHACEVAAAPEVQDSTSMRQFFERIGERYGQRYLDTRAARDTTRQVLREITADRPLDKNARRLAERLAKTGYLTADAQGAMR
jgi:hypothetical protein